MHRINQVKWQFPFRRRYIPDLLLKAAKPAPPLTVSPSRSPKRPSTGVKSAAKKEGDLLEEGGEEERVVRDVSVVSEDVK